MKNWPDVKKDLDNLSDTLDEIKKSEQILCRILRIDNINVIIS